MIWTELKLCVALHALSALKETKSMQICKQWDWVSKFAHGKRNIQPGQLGLLAKGVSHYGDLYSRKTNIVTDKKGNKSTATQLYLKHSLTRDNAINYFAEQHVKLSELEVKNLQCKDLVTGRQLCNMGKRAQKNLSKAMGFTSQKWDFQKDNPKNWEMRLRM